MTKHFTALGVDRNSQLERVNTLWHEYNHMTQIGGWLQLEEVGLRYLSTVDATSSESIGFRATQLLGAHFLTF